MAEYSGVFSKKVTPQGESIPESNQVPNSAGGFAWQVDDWVRLDRFLVLGAEGPTYYAGERKVKRENAEATVRCIKADGPRTVARIREISTAGRAPKNSPAIFALALAAKTGDQATRAAAYHAMSDVCRIGTHLFEFWQYCTDIGGSSAGLRRAIKRWYTEREPESLAYQLLKYQQRDKWSHRDLLRLVRPKATGVHNDIFHWAVKGWDGVGEEPHPDKAMRQIWAMERLKVASDRKEVAALIFDYSLPREVVPSNWLKEPDIWSALLHGMPMTAMIRNLATMTKIGLLKPMSHAEGSVIAQIGDIERLRKARVHPIALLSALKVYEQGHGERSDAQWSPCPRIVDALNEAFYATFKTIQPSNKRTMLAIDISGSMDGGLVAGIPGLSPRVASAAMALITANIEPQWTAVGFTAGNAPSLWSSGDGRYGAGLSPLTLSPRQRLDDVIRYMKSLDMGGTDCALPMIWASEQKAEIDTFIVYTDSETWAGRIHPAQALRTYRQQTGIPAKLIIVGMVSNEFTIADPDDAGMLDVVGFDSAAPSLMADFAR